MAVALSMVSLVVAALALLFSFLVYFTRTRPFVGVKSLNATQLNGSGERQLIIEAENVGEVPATEVKIQVSDSGGLIQHPEIFLGVIFPRQTVSFWIPVPESFTFAPDSVRSYLKPISPEERERRGLEDGDVVEEYVQVYPEGHEATMVTCQITYQQPPMLGFIPAGPYHTVQPFHVEHSGKAQPARSQQAKAT